MTLGREDRIRLIGPLASFPRATDARSRRRLRRAAVPVNAAPAGRLNAASGPLRSVGDDHLQLAVVPSTAPALWHSTRFASVPPALNETGHLLCTNRTFSCCDTPEMTIDIPSAGKYTPRHWPFHLIERQRGTAMQTWKRAARSSAIAASL